MPKVALINPGKNAAFAIQEPLNLGFIAAYLEKRGVQVRLIDQLAGDNVAQEIEDFSPDIVGITATTPTILEAYHIADWCRSRGIKTVMGGAHVSVLPEEALRHCDYVVRGEGEEAMWRIVSGNYFDSKIVSLPYIRNLDEVPSPSRHLMKMDFYLKTRDRLPDTYLYFVPPGTPTAAVLTSRGCPYDCIFCHNTWKGIPYRFHSVNHVIKELIDLIENYQTKAVFFIEDNLFVSRGRLKELCQQIKNYKLNLIWGGNARVDNIDPEILQIAREAGCRQITFGFESGSQKILDFLEKRTSVAKNYRAIKMCMDADIIPQGTFIIGCPNETIEDIDKTKSFIINSKLPSGGACIATPFPGTRLWKWCEDHGLIPQKLDWSKFNYASVPIPMSKHLTSAELLKEKAEIDLLFSRSLRNLSFASLVRHLFTKPMSVIFRALSFLKNPHHFLNFLRYWKRHRKSRKE